MIWLTISRKEMKKNVAMRFIARSNLRSWEEEVGNNSVLNKYSKVDLHSASSHAH